MGKEAIAIFNLSGKDSGKWQIKTLCTGAVNGNRTPRCNTHLMQKNSVWRKVKNDPRLRYGKIWKSFKAVTFCEHRRTQTKQTREKATGKQCYPPDHWYGSRSTHFRNLLIQIIFAKHPSLPAFLFWFFFFRNIEIQARTITNNRIHNVLVAVQFPVKAELLRHQRILLALVSPWKLFFLSKYHLFQLLKFGLGLYP